MKKILVVGEILVEIMADTTGRGFTETQALTGPFPSGAPAIFAAQAAAIGQPVGIVSAVGKDDFGQINIKKLSDIGVDVSGIFVDPDRPTGSAFVRYRENGDRDFVFNIRHSASGQLHVNDAVRQLIVDADHLHIMGSSLSSPAFVTINLDAAYKVRARGGTVSFDPNVRQEILHTPGLRSAMKQILTMTDLFLPSGEELTLFTESSDVQSAVSELLGSGITAIVHKHGSQGAVYYDAEQSLSASAFTVIEVDPTGAGDCFGATFTSLWLRQIPASEALKAATASGAIAVTQRGPMEGIATLSAVQEFLDTRALKTL